MMENINVLAFLQSILTTVLTFSGGAIPVFIIGWIVDRVASIAPVLKPFRELIVQWVRQRLEEIKLERAKGVVTVTGEAFRVETFKETLHMGVLPADRLELYKAQRKSDAVSAIIAAKIAKPSEASSLVDLAVVSLKQKGINP